VGPQRRNQRDKVDQTEFAVELALRQVPPAATAPPSVAMRPEAPDDPAIETMKEPADMGPTVVLAPAANDRVDLLDEHSRAHRGLAPRALSDLVLEVLDGLLAGVRVQPALSGTAVDPVGRQPVGSGNSSRVAEADPGDVRPRPRQANHRAAVRGGCIAVLTCSRSAVNLATFSSSVPSAVNDRSRLSVKYPWMAGSSVSRSALVTSLGNLRTSDAS